MKTKGIRISDIKNGKAQPVDEAGQIQGLPYDTNGNLIKSGFIFDAFDQLISAGGENFIYDAMGRRLQKGNISYLYIDDEEIGSFESGQAKELKILGHQNIVAIEVDKQAFAPIQDVEGTIRSLVDWKTKKLIKENSCDAFGFGLTDAIPYAYAGKRYDAKTGLIYFGKRYYDPQLTRWLTPDPLGPIDHSNLYQYVFNNPFLYRDPYGESIGGYLLGLGEIVLGGAIIAGGFALEVVTVGGFTIGLGVTTKTGLTLMGLGLATTTYHAQDIKAPNISWRNTDVYAPQWKEATKKPPRFNGKDLGSDPSQCPGEGFEWRGKGSPESGKGNWLNPDTGEKLHPDLWHPDPKGPHRGYKDSDGIPYDLFPNGSWQ